MIELTEEQREQLQAGAAIDVTDPKTAEVYVILRKDSYERVLHRLYDDSEWIDEDLRQLLALSSRENGWDEPGMDAYDRYDEELKKRCP